MCRLQKNNRSPAKGTEIEISYHDQTSNNNRRFNSSSELTLKVILYIK